MAENKMEQYCKLPIPVMAYQTDREMDIETLEGIHHASVGDWIITGVKGEQYPCKPDIFAKTYIKYGQANKMPQVAAMFGKELGKRFTVNFYNSLFDVAFDKSGLRVFSDEIFEDELSRLLLEGLIIGNVVIVDD
jgi:hypothetical protein